MPPDTKENILLIVYIHVCYSYAEVSGIYFEISEFCIDIVRAVIAQSAGLRAGRSVF
jgi:hypothetical protein